MAGTARLFLVAAQPVCEIGMAHTNRATSISACAGTVDLAAGRRLPAEFHGISSHGGRPHRARRAGVFALSWRPARGPSLWPRQATWLARQVTAGCAVRLAQ